MLTVEDAFLLMVFLSAVCGVLSLGAYITDNIMPRMRLTRRLRRLEPKP